MRHFGTFRLDVEKKVLWHEQEPVNLPLKEIEVLCVLTESAGEVVTKNELFEKVWSNSFVEESNLSRHIYLLRKTFKDYGESEEWIQTVPRRGYRFTGQVKQGEVVIEKHSMTRTLIEELDSSKKLVTGPRLLVSLGLLVAVVTSGFAVWRYYGKGHNPTVGIKSIAVLPFQTIDSNNALDHQGLGLTDILITRLSNIKELTVRPTSTVMPFRDRVEDTVSVGKQLQVDAVLEGTIYRVADKVRVTARLIRVSDRSTIWAGQFEKPQQDELTLQDEVALQVVDGLTLQLSSTEKKALTKRYTESADAYQLYVKGRYHWNKRSDEGMAEAERMFRNAIEKDPNFALAYVGLADTLAMGYRSAESSFSVKKALELDPTLAEGYATLGFLYIFGYWRWQDAEANLKKSIELNPGYATAHHWYATLLAIQGRFDDAKAEMHNALAINPLSHNFLTDLGQTHYFAGEYAQAEDYYRRAFEIYPDFVFAHQNLFELYLRTGDYAKAMDEHEMTSLANTDFRILPDEDRKAWMKVLADRKEANRRAGFRAFMESLLSVSNDPNPNMHYGRARFKTLLGEKQSALDDLEKAMEAKAFLMPYVKVDPLFDGLRGEERYREIIRKMNL